MSLNLFVSTARLESNIMFVENGRRNGKWGKWRDGVKIKFTEMACILGIDIQGNSQNETALLVMDPEILHYYLLLTMTLD